MIMSGLWWLWGSWWGRRWCMYTQLEEEVFSGEYFMKGPEVVNIGETKKNWSQFTTKWRRLSFYPCGIRSCRNKRTSLANIQWGRIWLYSKYRADVGEKSDPIETSISQSIAVLVKDKSLGGCQGLTREWRICQKIRSTSLAQIAFLIPSHWRRPWKSAENEQDW